MRSLLVLTAFVFPLLGTATLGQVTTGAPEATGEAQPGGLIELQISCMIREHPSEAITYVGGVLPDGTRWRKLRTGVIADLIAGTHSFFTFVNDVRAFVEIKESGGTVHIATKPDHVIANNLTELPDCPDIEE